MSVASAAYRNNEPFTETRAPVLWFFLLALGIRLAFVLVAGNNGSDAWARFLIAQNWVKHPGSLPSDVWLPMPFWLLGGALRIWNTEWSARLLTVLLGSLTVLPFWGIAKRLFDRRVAIYATLAFCLYGLHIAYSVTSSSEAPTILFQVGAIYAWLRFQSDRGWVWLVPSALALSAACLCRYEPWLSLPVLMIFLLSSLRGWDSVRYSKRAITRAAAFAVTASAGAIGWMTYSFIKWGDPLASAHRSAWLSAHMPHQSLIARVIAVPGALLITLSPVLLGLSIIGIVRVAHRRDLIVISLAVLALVMAIFNYFLAITKNSTMARFTLIYGWTLIPYAFEGLRELRFRWPWAGEPKAYSAVLAFFIVWQSGIIAGAHYGPQWVADKFSVVSPTLPLAVDLRNLTYWLKAHIKPNEAIIIDEFNYEAGEVIRYLGVPLRVFIPPEIDSDPATTTRQLRDFISRQHPLLIVYCPKGRLGTRWALGSGEQVYVAEMGLRLRLRWRGSLYSVYEIENFRAN